MQITLSNAKNQWAAKLPLMRLEKGPEKFSAQIYTDLRAGSWLASGEQALAICRALPRTSIHIRSAVLVYAHTYRHSRAHLMRLS